MIVFTLVSCGDPDICKGKSGVIVIQSEADIQKYSVCSKIHKIKIKHTGLQNLNGMENWKSIYRLIIENNKELKDINGLKNLKSVGSLSIKNNRNLRNIDGLKSLRESTQGDGFFLQNNRNLQNTNGLQNLKEIKGNFYIDNNDSLKSIRLESLKTVGKKIRIGDNQNLLNIKGFDSLISIGKSVGKGLWALAGLEIIRNDNLKAVYGFQNLKLTRGLMIVDNQSLIYINGFKNLKEITWDLIIVDNADLQKIREFKNLKKIGRKEIQPINHPFLPIK